MIKWDLSQGCMVGPTCKSQSDVKENPQNSEHYAEERHSQRTDFTQLYPASPLLGKDQRELKIYVHTTTYTEMLKTGLLIVVIKVVTIQMFQK